MTSIKTAVDEAWNYINEIRGDLQKELGNLRNEFSEEFEGGVFARSHNSWVELCGVVLAVAGAGLTRRGA